MYIYFEHWKVPRFKKAKDKLLLCLDTLKINYNPDTILALIHFANSVLQKPSNSSRTDGTLNSGAVSSQTIMEDAELNEFKNSNYRSSGQSQSESVVSSKKKKKLRVKDTALTLRLSFDFRQVRLWRICSKFTHFLVLEKVNKAFESL